MNENLFCTSEATAHDEHALVVARDYQRNAIDACRLALSRCRSALVVMATGLGKTIVFLLIAAACAKRGRVIIVVDRKTLVRQTVEKFRLVAGSTLGIEVEQGDHYVDEYATEKTRVIVATVQTLNSAGQDGRRRMERFDPNEFVFLIADEGHHAVAASWKRVFEHFAQNPNHKRIGVTATPDRSDEVALGAVYDDVAYEYDLADGIRDGWLCRPEEYAIPMSAVDLSSCPTTSGGDFNDEILEQIMSQPEATLALATDIHAKLGDRKAIIFGVRVRHAEAICAVLDSIEPGCAKCVFGKTPTEERNQTLREFDDGAFRFLVNVGVATEGFDARNVHAVVIARPTKSRSLYAQMVGRGTRTWSYDGRQSCVDGIELVQDRLLAIEGSPKPYCLILNYTPNAGQHKLMTTADVLGGKMPDEVVDKASQYIREKGEQGERVDVDKALKIAEEEIEIRNRERRRRLQEMKITVSWDAMRINPFDALDIRPERERGWWKDRKITPNMDRMLRRNNCDPDSMNYTQAIQLCRYISEHPERLPATDRQMDALRKFRRHLPRDVNLDRGLNKAEASMLMDGVAKKLGWKDKRN